MTALSELFSGNLMTAFGWTLLHSLWQGALIAIVVGVIMIFLRKASSRLHYLMYCIGLLLILATSTVTFLKYITHEPAISLTEESEKVSEINPAFIIFTDALLNTTDESKLMQGWNSFSDYFSRNVPLLVSLWFVGMIIFMLKFLGGLAYTQRLKHYKTVELPASWEKSFIDIAHRIGIRKSVQFIESYAIKVPIVINYFKPVVIIPVGMIGQMPMDQVEAVISHELAHIYRKDYLINLIQSLLEIIFFYHPAVWWLSANIRAERENICDDIAVANCGDSFIYAKALASVQELKLSSKILAPAFSGKKNILFNRIQRMMKTPRLMPNYTEGFITAVIVFISIAAISASAAISFNPETEDSLLNTFNTPTVSNTLQDWQDVVIPDTTIKKIKKIKKMTIKTQIDGDNVEIYSEDGKIKNVKVDGKEIPDEEFEKYEDFVADESILVDIDEDIEVDILREKLIELHEEIEGIQEVEFIIQKELQEALLEDQEAITESHHDILFELQERNAELDEHMIILQEMMPHPDCDSNDLKNVFFSYPHRYKPYGAGKSHSGYFISGEIDSIYDNVNWVGYNDSVYGNFEFFHNDSVFEFDNFEWSDEDFNKNFNIVYKHKYFPRDIIVDTDTKYEYALQKYITKAEQYHDQAEHLNDLYENNFYYNTQQFDSKTDRIVKKELQKDGLLGTYETDCIIELDNKNMYINGEKKSKSTYKKYRKLVESMIDIDLGDEFSYKLVL